MKKLKSLLVGVLVLALATSLVAGACAPAAPEEVAEEIAELEAEIADLEDDVAAEKAKTAAEKAKVSDLEADIAALKKPAEVIEWRFADIFARDSTSSICHQSWLKDIEVASNGRIEFTYYGTGELMATAEIADAVSKGVVESCHVGMGYTAGIVGRVGDLHSGISAYMNYPQVYGMLYENGERSDCTKILEEAYAAHNMMTVNAFLSCLGDFMYSTIELKSASDVVGLPFRTSGISSMILTKFGAATVWLPWEELYTALQMGTVKACEWGSPDLMYGLGLQEVCPYWYVPAWWGPGLEHRAINLDAWDTLPDDLQQIMLVAAKANWLTDQALKEELDSVALKKAAQEGVTVTQWSDEDMALFSSGWKDMMDEISVSGDPYCAELYEAMKDYRVSIGEWPE